MFMDSGIVPPIRGSWISIDRWADARTLKTFARSVLAIDNPSTDEEKALVLYKWLTRCYGRTGGHMEGPKGLESGIVDSLKDLTVYGLGLCDRWGRLLGRLAEEAGMEAYKIVSPYEQGYTHTMTEIKYRDNDGVERLHWFDAHLGRYVYSRDGSRIAGYDEIAEDGTLYSDPSKTSVPFVVRENDPEHYKKWGDEKAAEMAGFAKEKVFSLLPQSSHSTLKDLLPGETYTRIWERIKGQFYRAAVMGGSDKNLSASVCKDGWHDPTHTHFRNGAIKDPDNYPFWHNYMIDCACTPDHKVKPVGNGTVILEPDLRDDPGAVSPPENLTIDTDPDAPAIHPEHAKEMGMIVWEIKSPYIITDAEMEAEVIKNDGGVLAHAAFYASIDNGKTWFHIWSHPFNTRAEEPVSVKVNFGREKWDQNKPSVHGYYSYLIRAEMVSVESSVSVGLNSMKITNTVQLNMFCLPMLQPGSNKVTVEAEAIDSGWGIETTFIWDDKKGESRVNIHITKNVPDKYEISTDAEKVEDIRMRSITMRAVKT
jgi:hypothetical protein